MRSGDGEAVVFFFELAAGAQLLRCRRRIGSFRVQDLAQGRSTCVCVGRAGTASSGFAYNCSCFLFARAMNE